MAAGNRGSSDDRGPEHGGPVGRNCNDWIKIMNAKDMEAVIVRNAVHELLDHGFTLSVDNGGDDYEIDRSVDAEAVIAQLGHTDEDRLMARTGDTIKGWVHFVYGNDGYDVICDMTVSLEPYLPDTLAIAEGYAELHG
jgi:hypothetical protein